MKLALSEAPKTGFVAMRPILFIELGGLFLCYFSDNFAVLAKVFSSDIVSQCTFCSSPENYYNVGFNSVTIDHVLYKGYKSVVSSLDIVDQCTFCSSPENYYNVGFWIQICRK